MLCLPACMFEPQQRDLAACFALKQSNVRASCRSASIQHRHSTHGVDRNMLMESLCSCASRRCSRTSNGQLWASYLGSAVPVGSRPVGSSCCCSGCPFHGKLRMPAPECNRPNDDFKPVGGHDGIVPRQEQWSSSSNLAFNPAVSNSTTCNDNLLPSNIAYTASSVTPATLTVYNNDDSASIPDHMAFLGSQPSDNPDRSAQHTCLGSCIESSKDSSTLT